MRNPCKNCIYYCKKNKTCQSKKCATGGSGKVSWIDRLFCSPYKDNREENPMKLVHTKPLPIKYCFSREKE